MEAGFCLVQNVEIDFQLAYGQAGMSNAQRQNSPVTGTPGPGVRVVIGAIARMLAEKKWPACGADPGPSSHRRLPVALGGDPALIMALTDLHPVTFLRRASRLGYLANITFSVFLSLPDPGNAGGFVGQRPQVDLRPGGLLRRERPPTGPRQEQGGPAL